MPAADDGKAIVLFDGGCPFCRRSVRILKKLDWLGRLAYRDARDVENWPACEVKLDSTKLLEQMHVVTPDRKRVKIGFGAPLAYLPGAMWLGNKAYRWVAKRRYGILPCEGGVCRVGAKL
jgi:predicted DCC family thiol-disulfide oxidoreductase YuxK